MRAWKVARRLVFFFISAIYLGTSLGGCISSDLDARVVRANRLQEQGKYDEAAKEWLKVTRMQGDYLPGYINAAEAYQRAGRVHESLAVLDKARQLDPQPEVFLLSGKAKYETGDHSGAATEWTELLRVQPLVADNYLRLGSLYEEVGESERALALYKEAGEVDQKNPEVSWSIARVLVREGKTREAIPHLERAAYLERGEKSYSAAPGHVVVGSGLTALRRKNGTQPAATERTEPGKVIEENAKLRSALVTFEREVAALREAAATAIESNTRMGDRLVLMERAISDLKEESATEKARLIRERDVLVADVRRKLTELESLSVRTRRAEEAWRVAESAIKAEAAARKAADAKVRVQVEALKAASAEAKKMIKEVGAASGPNQPRN